MQNIKISIPAWFFVASSLCVLACGLSLTCHAQGLQPVHTDLNKNIDYAAEAVPLGPSFADNYPLSSATVGMNMATSNPISSLECALLAAIPPMHALSHFAVGINAGSLGLGVEAATPLANRINLRAGVNLFDYSQSLLQKGITYNANLTLLSVQASVDWFPYGGGFHISPGVMLYNGNHVNANLAVPIGTVINLDNVNYYSDPADPLAGSAKITFPFAGPQLTVGFGNMIPRKPGKHITVPFELGAVYFGTGTALLNFTGTACTTLGSVNCMPVNSFPRFQADVAAEQATIQKNLNYARFFPILRIGVSYKF